jgi:hypothetical protein
MSAPPSTPALLHPRLHRLPAATLVPNLNAVATTPCNVCARPVRGDFNPIYCHVHRNNITPVSGWAFLLRSEIRLINILRHHRWTDDAPAEVAQRGEQVEIAQLADGLDEQLLLGDAAAADDPYRDPDTPDYSSGDDL